MNAPTAPDLAARRTVRQRVRGLGSRLARSRRRAAVVTSATLLSAGSFATLAYEAAPEATPAAHAPVVAVSDAAPEEAPPMTLLPADTVDIPVEAVSDVREEAGSFHSEGRASYYGRELAGNPTASGERFDPSDLTAAHRTLPFGTRVRVTNQRNGESVVVRINDRGPFHGGRIIDVSRAAADEIGMTGRGTVKVSLEILPDTPRGVRG